MKDALPTRLIGAVGVVGFLVPALGTYLAAPTWFFPSTESGASAFAAHLGEHGQVLRLGVLLDAVGVTLWGVFAVGVWVTLRRATGGESFWSACFLIGVTWFVSLLTAGFTSFLVLTYRVPDAHDARLAYDLAFGLLAISGLPTAVALTAYAAMTLRSGLMPRSTAVLAIVAVAAHMTLPLSFFATSGFFSMEGQIISAAPTPLFLWVLATAIALLRGYPQVAAVPQQSEA